MGFACDMRMECKQTETEAKEQRSMRRIFLYMAMAKRSTKANLFGCIHSGALYVQHTWICNTCVCLVCVCRMKIHSRRQCQKHEFTFFFFLCLILRMLIVICANTHTHTNTHSHTYYGSCYKSLRGTFLFCCHNLNIKMYYYMNNICIIVHMYFRYV